jgi:protein SCO1/2
VAGGWLRILCPAAAAIALALVPCQAGAAQREIKRTIETYQAPDVVLIDQEGARVRFLDVVQSDKPVIIDFIFGTCTTICPVLSVGFLNLQRKLGPDAGKVHLVSISIDPEYDTPKIMKEYLKRYQAKPGWDFFTGSRQDIDSVMKAFDAYIPDKMYHYPLTLLKAPGENQWVRVFGLMSSSEFLAECAKVGIR